MRFCVRIGLRAGVGLLALAPVNAQNIESFVAVAPCRVVDTRLANSALGGPIMNAGSTRSFPLPSSACGLPSNAAAYSLNVTVVPVARLSYLTIWPTGSAQPVVSTLNDFEATVLANAAIVRAGTSGAISIFVTDASHVVIDMNGYFISNTNVTTDNTTLGANALAPTAGAQNTGIGFGALSNNISGNFNTALGSTALNSNSTGGNNTAVGQSTLAANATGSGNTAIGYAALFSEASATDNVAIGNRSMNGATGSGNVAIGSSSLLGVTGTGNIAVGSSAGVNVGSGIDNIDIGNTGISTDSGTIRIGASGNQTSAFIAGVSGVNIGAGAAVMINTNGQLGTVVSSQRYKEDIHPMADSSDALMKLEPVTFRYKQPAPDGSRDLQYGLIAEQVAAVYPELTVYDKDRKVETLQYHELPAMLLNEIQKQHRTIQNLETRISALEQLVKAGNTATVSTVAGQ